jgi:hypothetical protein
MPRRLSIALVVHKLIDSKLFLLIICLLLDPFADIHQAVIGILLQTKFAEM